MLTTPDAMHIAPDALYEDGTIRLILGVTEATLARARRDGKLRYRRCGQRTLYLGRWIIDWITGNEEVSR